MKHLGDITNINGADIEPVDCIVGGSPCQDLSVAGLRKGMQHEAKGDVETTRSGLFIEQIRVTKELRENDRKIGRTGQYVRPRYFVWENVPGALSSNKGEDFRCVLEETARIVQEDAVIPKPPRGGGLMPEASWEVGGALLGEYMMHSISECHNVDEEYVYWQTSMGTPQQTYCLTLNIGEKPREPNPSRLSEILQDEVNPKYNLSEKACLGILKRARKRGKELPEILENALKAQAHEE